MDCLSNFCNRTSSYILDLSHLFPLCLFFGRYTVYHMKVSKLMTISHYLMREVIILGIEISLEKSTASDDLSNEKACAFKK